MPAEAAPKLAGLRLKELRQRAREAGVDADELEEATDADNPKAAVTALILEHMPAEAAPGHGLKKELEGLRLKELRARAKAAGIDEDALEDANDADEPKGAVI